MAQRKISELEQTMSIEEESLFPIVQNGATRSITYKNLKRPLINEVTADVSIYADEKHNEATTYTDEKHNEAKNYTDDEINSAVATVNNKITTVDNKITTLDNKVNGYHTFNKESEFVDSKANFDSVDAICKYIASPSKVKMTAWGVGQGSAYGLCIQDDIFKTNKCIILKAVLILKKTSNTYENEIRELKGVHGSSTSSTYKDYWLFNDLVPTDTKINQNFNVNTMLKYLYVEYIKLK